MTRSTVELTNGRPLGAELAEIDLNLLLMIRHFEEGLLGLFAQGRLNGTTHTCLGQEYIPVALRTLLRSDDHIFSNHRGHGHYLARFDDPAGLLAEIMGRAGAVCNGVGGSQHLHRGTYLSTGVQGESVAVASGVAIHLSRAARGQLAVVFIGDGTWGEGVVYEALNLARLRWLPLLVVVENNHIAQTTRLDHNMAGTVGGRAQAFDIDFQHIATNDIADIRAVLAPRITAMRERPAPLIVEFDTTRLGPHSKGDDTRGPDELDGIRACDWYVTLAHSLDERFAAADDRQRRRIAQVIDEVSGRPISSWPR
jgi:pyruvate dehydrogenase E1 component alpha subunit